MLLKYEIKSGETLSHWLYSGIGKKAVEAPEESFYAPVNTGEAYVQIVYPVRKHFLENHALKDIARYDGDYPLAYFPFEDSKVNFSTAIKTPTHIWTYLKSYVTVPEGGEYPFSIATCGGVKLWVDGEEALSFSPYDRNIPHSTDFTISLSEGCHTFEIYMDELAERDAFFYFDFIYRGQKNIKESFDTEADPILVHQAEKFLESISLTCTVYRYGGIEADFDSSMLTSPLTLYVDNLSSSTLEFTVQNGMNHLKLIESFNEVAGRTAVFSARIGNIEMRRKIYYAELPLHLTELPSYDTVESRKAEALRFASRYGDRNITQAMATMRIEGRISDETRKSIENSLLSIEKKEDCADFFLAPILWSMKAMGNLYPEDLYERAKKAVLGFRYWIDEKGNDAMWYFSENHAFLFHVSQYLAGTMFPDETFTVSDRKGREQRNVGKSRLFGWFRNFGLYHYAEWNSATYFPVDLIGLFSLYEAAEDEDMRAKAEDALNYTFSMIRDNTFHGMMAASYGRAYEDTVKAKEVTEPAFLSYIAYGKGHATPSCRASALFSISSYTPPFAAADEVPNGKLKEVIAVQGEKPVWTYSAKTNDYIIASAESFKPFRHGHQQHIMDCMIGREAYFFINHPGEKAYSGENRPAYWAGNGTIPLSIQYKSLLMMIFHTEEQEAVKYIHAYYPTWMFDEWSVEGHYVFARSGDGYLGAYFSSEPKLTGWGMNRNREIIARGSSNLAVVRCSDRWESGSYENFKALFKSSEADYDEKNDKASFEDFAFGLLEAGKDSVPRINGKEYDWRDSEGYAVRLSDIKQF